MSAVTLGQAEALVKALPVQDQQRLIERIGVSPRFGGKGPMNYENRPEREQIVEQALTARTLPEAEAAVRGLRQWIQVHPDDPDRGGVDASYGVFTVEHQDDKVLTVLALEELGEDPNGILRAVNARRLL